MAIADDWTLDYSAKTISHTSGSTRYTVQEFYSWLMDLFDDSAQMDDAVPMSAQTPREYTLINGWALGAAGDYDYLKSGSVVDSTNNDIWACFYTLGNYTGSNVMYIEQNGALVTPYAGYTAGAVDQLIKVTAAGTDIDGKKVTIYCRDLGNSYDNFEATATATGGYNPVPISVAADANDTASGGSVAGVSLAFGTVAKDIGDGNGAVNYDVTIDGGGNTTAEVYEYLKYITRRENTTAIDSPEEPIAGRFWQSVDPATYAIIKTAPFGTYAGGKFFGAQGIWLENVSDLNNRELIDAAGASHTPPVSISVAVSGVDIGSQVLVAVDDGAGAIDKAQYTISSATASTVVSTTALSADTPATGTLRVGDTVYSYTGWSGSTFSGVTPNPSAETGSFYVPLVDGVATGTSMTSGAMIYSADIDVIARVRKYGLLPFENTGTVTTAGLTVSAIKTTDSIVA